MLDFNAKRRIYYPEEQAEYFKKDWGGTNHLRKVELPVRILENAIVIPPLPVNNAYGASGMETGVLDCDGRYVPGSGMRDWLEDEVISPNRVKFLNESAIYCGLLFPHYGHFLLQSTTRLYYYLKHRDFSGKLLFTWPTGTSRMPRYMVDFFSLLEIPLDRILLVSTFVKVRELVVPPLASQYDTDFTPDFILPFQMAAEQVPASNHKKIFFSRRKWNGIAKCFGEEQLERLFCGNGFTPIMPERFSLREQISLIKGADVVAGINGTAFHNIAFGAPGKKVIILNRTEEYESQFLFNDATSADWYVVKVHANPFPVNHPHGPFIVGLTPELREFCADHGLKTFGITFSPDKYLKSFLDYYCIVYSQVAPMQELITRRKDRVDTADLVRVISLVQNRRMDLWLYRLLFRLTAGFRKRYYDLKCQTIKNLYKDESSWKY